MLLSPDRARLFRTRAPRSPRAVVLVLHGGAERSTHGVTSWNLAVLRLRPVAWVIARRVREVSVYRLQFSTYGWNEAGLEALRDARWALTQLRSQNPGLPIIVVGHSLGARVALRIGGDPEVAGAVALTPWAPNDDPVDHLRDVRLLVGQGAKDTTCPVSDNRQFFDRAEAAGADVDRTILAGLGHFMLWRFWIWHRFAAEAVARLVPLRANRS